MELFFPPVYLKDGVKDLLHQISNYELFYSSVKISLLSLFLSLNWSSVKSEEDLQFLVLQ